MGKIVRFISEGMNKGLSRLVDKMCGFRTKSTSSIFELQKQNYEELIEDSRVELKKCEECGDEEGIEYYGMLVKLFEDDLERLERLEGEMK